MPEDDSPLALVSVYMVRSEDDNTTNYPSSGVVQDSMRWARRQSTSLPHRFFVSQEELDCAAVDHDILMIEPILVPVLAIDLDALHKEPALSQAGFVGDIVGKNPQCLVDIDCYVYICKPWRIEQVHWLRDNGVEA